MEDTINLGLDKTETNEQIKIIIKDFIPVFTDEEYKKGLYFSFKIKNRIDENLILMFVDLLNRNNIEKADKLNVIFENL